MDDREIIQWDKRLTDQARRGWDNYKHLHIDLSTARIDQSYLMAGEYLYVEESSSTLAKAKIKLNRKSNDELDLEKGVKIETVFIEIFISNDALEDKWLDLVFGINFKYKKKIIELEPGLVDVVRDFGADPTGMTDSTTAIQAAIDYCNTYSLSPLYFPTGTFIINWPLIITQVRFVIKGESMYRTKIKTGTSWVGNKMLDFSGTSASWMTIENLYIFGNGKLNTDADGIVFANTVDVTLRDVLMYNVNDGLQVTGGTKLRLEGVYISTAYRGFRLSGLRSIVATNCVIEGTDIGMWLSNVVDSTFIGQWFEANVDYCLYASNGCRNNTFIGGYWNHNGTSENIIFDNVGVHKDNIFMNVEFVWDKGITNQSANPLYFINCKSLPTVTGAYRTALDPYDLSGSDTWDPGSIADGDEEAKEVTVTGAALGDFAMASFNLDLSDLILDAQVTAANTVTCILANNTGGAIDLASGTIYVRVMKK